MLKILNYLKVGLVSLTVLILLLYLTDTVSLDFLLQFSMALVVILVLVTLGGAMFNFFENPKSGVRFFVGIVAILLFFAIGYGISTDTVDPVSKEIVNGSRMAEAGIYTCYFLFLVSGVAIVYSTIKRIFG